MVNVPELLTPPRSDPDLLLEISPSSMTKIPALLTPPAPLLEVLFEMTPFFIVKLPVVSLYTPLPELPAVFPEISPPSTVIDPRLWTPPPRELIVLEEITTPSFMRIVPSSSFLTPPPAVLTTRIKS